MSSRYVIFGGLGFLGNAIVRRLASKNENVLIVDRKDRMHTARGLGRFIPPGVTLIDCLATSEIRSVLRSGDYVLDFWNHGSPAVSPNTVSVILKDLVENSVSLFEQAAAIGVAKIIFASSGGSVYGACNTPFLTELSSTEPISGYGFTKVALENALRYISYRANMDHVVLRIANAYGPGSHSGDTQNLIAKACRCAKDSCVLKIWGNGEAIRDYIYIDDIVSAVELACRSSGAKGIFNIGTGSGTRVKDVIRLVECVSHKDIRIETQPDRACDPSCNVLDITRAQATLGWTPAISLIDGIDHTWASLCGREESFSRAGH